MNQSEANLEMESLSNIIRAQEAGISYVLCSCASFHMPPELMRVPHGSIDASTDGDARYMKCRRAPCPYIGLIDMCHVVGAT